MSAYIELYPSQISATRPLATITQNQPQIGDHELVLLAKIASSLGGGAVAGSEGIIRSVGVSVRVTSTPVLTTGGAAATGDYVGPSTAPASFVNAVRVAGGTGVIKSITITDKLTTAEVALELWLFSETFTAPADNAAWAITDAHQLTCLGVIPIATDKWYANANGQVYSDDTLGLIIKPTARDLFYAIVARGTTPAWASGAGGDLQLSLGILQD